MLFFAPWGTQIQSKKKKKRKKVPLLHTLIEQIWNHGSHEDHHVQAAPSVLLPSRLRPPDPAAAQRGRHHPAQRRRSTAGRAHLVRIGDERGAELRTSFHCKRASRHQLSGTCARPRTTVTTCKTRCRQRFSGHDLLRWLCPRFFRFLLKGLHSDKSPGSLTCIVWAYFCQSHAAHRDGRNFGFFRSRRLPSLRRRGRQFFKRSPAVMPVATEARHAMFTTGGVWGKKLIFLREREMGWNAYISFPW